MKLLIQSWQNISVVQMEAIGIPGNILEQVEMETPLARRDEGKISAGIAQGTGPQLAPNAII